MERLRELLQRGRNGNAVLFCGAGLTADCLNFTDDSTLGVTFHLLQLVNDELKAKGKQSGYRDIKNATKRFKTDLGSVGLMRLLQGKFQLNKVSASIHDIVEYPWKAIYTTNYDNGLEIALQNVGRKFKPINNLDDPDEEITGTPVIHLHGRAESWTPANFEQSCVLDADSYLKLSGVSKWLSRLRFDVERAEVVVFIGFSLADFHLAQAFFNASGLQKKAFFINRPTPTPDIDERATQEDFGEPLYIGREEFSQLVTEVLRDEVPREPQLSSFTRYQTVQSSASVPPVEDIEDLLVWGKVNPAHLKRDHDLDVSHYHVLREEVATIKRYLDDAGKIVLLHGDICEGKSLVVLGVMNAIAAGRSVFELRHPYADIVSEVNAILSVYPDALFVVENCFSLREDRLLGLARQVAGGQGGLILSARSISTEAESGKYRAIRSIPSALEVRVGRLQSAEIEALIGLVDQIAGWKAFRALTPSERRRFVEVECHGVIPSVLLRLLNSDYVRNKYREEYNKVNYRDPRDRQMVIASLLIAGIGFDTPVGFISDIFERDFALVLREMEAEKRGIKLVRADGDFVRSVPSIGARNLLKNVVEVRDTVNTTIHILEKLSEEYCRTDFQAHIFFQLMRYSILSSVVSDEAEINRFFDHISKISYFRELPLFWLQWHMAMAAQKRWLKAEEYLQMGNKAADVLDKQRNEKFNRKQLNDRHAKFLAARAIDMLKTDAELFRDMKDAVEIVGRLLTDAELSHHPYEPTFPK